MVARSSPVSSTIPDLTSRPPSSMRCRVRLRAFDLPCAHVKSRPTGLMPVARRSVAPERRQCRGQLRRSSPRPALKERSPALRPCLPLSGIPRLSQYDQRARQFVSAEAICSSGDDEFTKLLYLTALEVTSLVHKCLQFDIKVPWLAHRCLRECRWRKDSRAP